MNNHHNAKNSGLNSSMAVFWKFEPFILPLLYLAFLLLGLFVHGEIGYHTYLYLPLAMGFGIQIGQRMLLPGVLLVVVLLLTVVGACLVFRMGPFAVGVSFDEFRYVLALIVLMPCMSLMSALVAAYNRRSIELSEGREAMMSKVFDALPIGIWVRGASGETVFVNARWLSFATDPAVEGRDPVDLGSEWQREAEEVMHSSDGATRYRAIELKDQHGINCSLTLFTLRVYVDVLNDYGLLCLLVDETAVRLYEVKIRESERQLRMALDNSEMGYWEQDVRSGHASTDINCLRMLGVDSVHAQDNEALWTELIHPDDAAAVLSARQSLLSGHEESLHMDYRIRNLSGDYLWVLDRMHIASRDESGAVSRIFGTIEDISERKRFEIDLRHAKDRAESANSAKGHFIATISHEIRTPLNAIIGLSSFLTDTEMDAEQKDLVDTIHSSGQNLLYLVNDILDFSKIEAGRLELEVQEYPIRLCFEDCVKLFKMRAAEKNVDLRLNLDESLTEFALGDMERLRQIVQNLLANALKFTDHGMVELGVSRIDLSELPDTHRPDPLVPTGYLDQPDHDYIRIQVKDTGIGIPKDRQHILFDAFSQADPSMTRKYGGTGLGLAICKRLVEAMGGDIWVESVEGKGAVFCFVVRTILIYEAANASPSHQRVTDVVPRIAEEHPCDLLVVGSKEATEDLLLACRKLGYVPHRSLDYALNKDALLRRKYGIVFICMGDEVRGLQLSRRIASVSKTHQPRAIVGFGADAGKFSADRLKLAGMLHLIEGDRLDVGPVRAKILEVLAGND